MAKASDNDFPSWLVTEQASKPSAPAAGKQRLYMKTDQKLYHEDSGGTETEVGGGGVGDMLWSVIQASQLVNEIKGWPPTVNAGDLAALNLWWDSLGTPTTAPTVQDTSAAGLTDDYELCLKCVTDAAGEGLYQRFTYADEPRVKAGRVVSAIVAVWSVSSVSVDVLLTNSDASHTHGNAKTTAAAWTIITVENHTLAGTYCDLQVITDAADGTFYAVPLGMNIGARGVPLPPRPSRFVDMSSVNIVNNVDTGTSWTDADVTANTSPLAHRALLGCFYKNAQRSTSMLVRRNGSASNVCVVAANQSTSTYGSSQAICELDDGNIFEYLGNGIAGDTEYCFIDLCGYWEWA